MPRSITKPMFPSAFALSMALLAVAPARAQEAKPDNELTFNAALVSDYRYRGISQSRLDPALQGGADYTHNPSGWYAGVWLSSIRWTKDAGGGGDLEMDVYGGKRGEVAKDVSYDLGVLGYVYPSNGLSPNANTFEVYGQLGYGPVYAKYSLSTTNLFGAPNSKGSGYLDLGGSFALSPGVALTAHVGRQTVRRNGQLGYTDYKLGVSKNFGVAVVTLAAVYADTGAYLGPAPGVKNLGKGAAVLSVAKTF